MNDIIYEYIGFTYKIVLDDPCGFPVAVPLDGQHSAARKDKHCRAAVECWEQDGRPTKGPSQ